MLVTSIGSADSGVRLGALCAKRAIREIRDGGCPSDVGNTEEHNQLRGRFMSAEKTLAECGGFSERDSRLGSGYTTR
jgi:hypothetical protein